MSNNSMIDDMIANDPELLESFINESREGLGDAEKDLKCIQQSSGSSDPQCIERAFRSIHTLKSAAGFLGLDKVSKLALRMEEILGHLRSGSISPEVKIVELLLEGVRILKDILSDPMDSSDIDTKEILEKLAEHMAAHHGK